MLAETILSGEVSGTVGTFGTSFDHIIVHSLEMFPHPVQSEESLGTHGTEERAGLWMTARLMLRYADRIDVCDRTVIAFPATVGYDNWRKKITFNLSKVTISTIPPAMHTGKQNIFEFKFSIIFMLVKPS